MFKGNFEIELYDLSEDLSESNNVAEQHPDLVERIEQIMLTAREPSQVLKFDALDEWQATRQKQ